MYQEYKRILVPIDGSDEARLAFEKAVEVAKRNQARIILTHVIDTRALQTPSGFEGEFSDELERQARTLFEEYIQFSHSHGFEQIETVIDYGSPKVLISKDIPIEYHIDLIMIGATGLNAVERLFMGSVSEFVIRNATCDVMVVRTNLENQRPEA